MRGKIYTALLLITLTFPAQRLRANCIAGDSLPKQETDNPASDLAGNICRSVVYNMDDEQLTRLIIYLFEADTIPYDLAKEIHEAVMERTKDMRLREEQEDKTACDSISSPASEYYSCWELEKVFTDDSILLKTDTSFTLELINQNIGYFCQPALGIITSGFGWRERGYHKGIDVDLNKGDPVICAFDGMVRIARREGNYGNVVIVRHFNGLETVYGHLSKIKVSVGQMVKSGELLGLGGNTGRSTGAHLHFETRFKGQAFNPRYIIDFNKQELLAEKIVIKNTKWGISAFPENAEFHIVEKGDSIFEIAKRYGTTTTKIRDLNGMTRKNYLVAGQRVRVD